MSGRRVVVEIHESGKTFRVRGWQVHALLKEANYRPVFAGGGWTLDIRHLPDVAALLEWQSASLRIVDPRGAAE